MDHHAPTLESPPALQPQASAAAPSSGPSTALVPVRHDNWTPQKQAAFLHALAATHNVALAAREAGMSRQSAYKLRARLKGEPFDHAWEAAFATCYDRLAEAAMERALNGVEVPHYHRGELVGTHRRFDERLTLGLLALRAGAPGRTRPVPPPAQGLIGDVAALIARVEAGPATWEEQIADERERRYAEMDAGEDGEDGFDDADGCDEHPAFDQANDWENEDADEEDEWEDAARRQAENDADDDGRPGGRAPVATAETAGEVFIARGVTPGVGEDFPATPRVWVL